MKQNLKHIKIEKGSKYFNQFIDLPKTLKHSLYTHFDRNNPFISDAFLVFRNDQAVARFALYENEDLSYQNKNCLMLGSYCSVDSLAVNRYVFNLCKKLARKKSYSTIIGPMEGSTFENYRSNTRQIKKSFFFDLDFPSYYSKHFENFGFNTLCEYSSNQITDLRYDRQKLDEIQTMYESKGAIFKSLNTKQIRQEFFKIAEFCNVAFANNFLFTPTKNNRFLDKYKGILPILDARFVRLVYDQKDNLHGLVFCIPDPSDKKTLIIKTIATLPKSKFKGVATFLSRKMIQVAAENGFNRIIHAFIKNDNHSMATSKNMKAQELQEYKLYIHEIIEE